MDKSENTTSAKRVKSARIDAPTAAAISEKYAAVIETEGFSFAVNVALTEYLTLPRPRSVSERRAAGGRAARGEAKNPHRKRSKASAAAGRTE